VPHYRGITATLQGGYCHIKGVVLQYRLFTATLRGGVGRNQQSDACLEGINLRLHH